MKLTSLDAITRSVLHQRQLPKHYYLQYLKYAADCFRELRISTLRVVNTRKLPVTSTGIVTIPCDCIDVIRVGVPVGQMVKPLHINEHLNRLDNLDANGRPIPYAQDEYGTVSGGLTVTTNDLGEFIGRWFGYNDGLQQDTYRVLPERNVIQMNQSLGLKEVIVEYVADTSCIDNITKVDVLAQDTIESFIKWQASPNADNPRSPEAFKYTQALRHLKARKNPLSGADIIRSYKSGIKTIR